ncbi:NADH-quinone oxidoreductase subunit J family protein [Actomonas aquatica]|uniref:NADH-quinone oxidoreductase subunit J n=1 Tax=Actomonas aquatica TaxID=2866162 RepID=A0ABZ1CBJ9_9BACT|nr:NADH-quinone oxidoreductase subunit J [Opitutus sp. WL0086]WRQ88760.1 NADH-quinone oxidoreductase subunit J [Opitutus sp. WL0086]
MIGFVIITGFIAGSVALAFTRRNPVHAALLLVLTWAGIGSYYLWAGAEFLAFAQLLVYAGAISMVVLFAVLLTRPQPEDPADLPPDSRKRASMAIIAAAAVGAVLFKAISATEFKTAPATAPTVTVKDLGEQLMGAYAPALLIVGLILTIALIGATTIAAARRVSSTNRAQPEDHA